MSEKAAVPSPEPVATTSTNVAAASACCNDEVQREHMRRAHEHRLARLRVHAAESDAEPERAATPSWRSSARQLRSRTLRWACRAALSILQLRTPDLSSKQNTASGPWRIGKFQKLFPEILPSEKTHQRAPRVLKADRDILLLHQFALQLPPAEVPGVASARRGGPSLSLARCPSSSRRLLIASKGSTIISISEASSRGKCQIKRSAPGLSCSSVGLLHWHSSACWEW